MLWTNIKSLSNPLLEGVTVVYKTLLLCKDVVKTSLAQTPLFCVSMYFSVRCLASQFRHTCILVHVSHSLLNYWPSLCLLRDWRVTSHTAL